jgi:hypothetical protein
MRCCEYGNEQSVPYKAGNTFDYCSSISFPRTMLPKVLVNLLVCKSVNLLLSHILNDVLVSLLVNRLMH